MASLLLKLTSEALDAQEAEIRSALSGLIREWPGTYVSLAAAAILLRITDCKNLNALAEFYAVDYVALTDLVQDQLLDHGRVGSCFPLLDYQRLVLYQSIAELRDAEYVHIKPVLLKLEHLLDSVN